MILQLDALEKSFGALRVADKISLSVEPGEALGIIGPNGAGKTTLFGLVSGALKPSAGKVWLEGKDVTSLSAEARCRAGIGRSHQVPLPFEKLTVFENVLTAACFGQGKREREVVEHCGEVLEQTQLLSKANRLAGTLTLIDRKRLEMARALATSPRLLLLDEIAGGLTEGECRDLVALIRAINARGVTLIWIEHIVHALTAVVSRLVVLNFGAKIAEGEPQAVMNSKEVREIYLGIAGMSLLSTHGLTAFYGDFQALYGLDLEIGEGETVAIIGANGAGKSTLLKTLTGLIATRRDAVRYAGDEIGGLPAPEILKRGIAMVPEGRKLFPSLTVEENLRIGGDVRRGDGPWSLESVYALFPVLSERRANPGTALSGGQQQMVAIGRALMSNPRLLLCDEISLGLAPIVIKDIYAALPRIKAGGAAIVIVEQDIVQALAVADRVYCLQEGRVTLTGRPEELTREAIQEAYFGH